jgi:hypothetical protein
MVNKPDANRDIIGIIFCTVQSLHLHCLPMDRNTTAINQCIIVFNLVIKLWKSVVPVSSLCSVIYFWIFHIQLLSWTRYAYVHRFKYIRESVVAMNVILMIHAAYLLAHTVWRRAS